MERLVTTGEAAKILNLSLQGIHYRIKNNSLKSIKQNGKTYVYIDEKELVHKEETTSETSTIIKLKDEQIELLKKVIKWHKKQYKKELLRLQNAHNDLKEVMKSEIKLLQDAFFEMRKIYQNQIPTKKINVDDNDKYIPLKDFIILLKKHGNKNIDIKKMVVDKIKQKDDKFVYNKDKKEIYVHKSYFLDLL